MRRLITDFRRGDLSGRCRYQLRLEKVPQISQIYTDFSWDVFLVTQISQMTQIFFIHRMTRNLFGGIPDKAITHGFSQRRPIRSVQIPPKVGKSPTDFTDIHRFFLGRFFSHADFADDADFFYSSDDTEFIRRFPWWGDYTRIFAEATCPVGADTPWNWNMSHKEKSASSAKSAWQKTTGAYIGREPLASGQSSAKFRE